MVKLRTDLRLKMGLLGVRLKLYFIMCPKYAENFPKICQSRVTLIVALPDLRIISSEIRYPAFVDNRDKCSTKTF